MAAVDKHILVIDDVYGDPSCEQHHQFLEWVSEEPSWKLSWCTSMRAGEPAPQIAIDRIKERWSSEAGYWSLVLLDVHFVGQDPYDEQIGFQILRRLREHRSPLADVPVVMLTAEDGHKSNAAKLGADGYLSKPVDEGRSDGGVHIRDALKSRLRIFGLYPDEHGKLVGKSLPFLKFLREARRTAAHQLDRVLYGETGSGKTEIGRFIHETAAREGSYVRWSARASADQAIIEDQLFGHWKRAFDGATDHAAGVFEQAHRGTLLLDEIQNLGGRAQQLLLDARRKDDQNRRSIPRMGTFSTQAALEAGVEHMLLGNTVGVDVQLLCATNVALYDDDIRERYDFRKDLLNDLGHPLHVPPLRARLEDVQDLFEGFVAQARRQILLVSNDAGRPHRIAVDTAVRDWATAQDWRNRNIAVLKRVAEYAAATSIDFDSVHMSHLGAYANDLDGRPRDSGDRAVATSARGATLDDALTVLSRPLPADVPLEGALERVRKHLGPLLVELFVKAMADRRGRGQAEVGLLLGKSVNATEARKVIGRWAAVLEAGDGSESPLAAHPLTRQLVDWAKRR